MKRVYAARIITGVEDMQLLWDFSVRYSPRKPCRKPFELLYLKAPTTVGILTGSPNPTTFWV